MEKALPHVKNAVSLLVDQLGPGDSVAIYSFAERLVLHQDFTKDRAAAKRSVLQLRAGGEPPSSMPCPSYHRRSVNNPAKKPLSSSPMATTTPAC
jgi:hypothetical protein